MELPKDVAIKQYINNLAMQLNGIYPGIMSLERVESLIDRFAYQDGDYNVTISQIGSIVRDLVEEYEKEFNVSNDKIVPVSGKNEQEKRLLKVNNGGITNVVSIIIAVTISCVVILALVYFVVIVK